MEEKHRLTLEEAAAKIVFRADDLAAIAPDVGIDLTTPDHQDGTLSASEVERLVQLTDQIKQFYNPEMEAQEGSKTK